MADRELLYRLDFRLGVGVFSGLGTAGLIDRAVVRRTNGFPVIPGSTVKGRLRFFAERALAGAREHGTISYHGQGRQFCRVPAGACTVCRLFGSPTLPAHLRVGDALPVAGSRGVRGGEGEVRAGIAISRRRRTVLPDHLFYDEEIQDVAFEGEILLDSSVPDAEEKLLVGIGALVDGVGSRKATGRGSLEGGIRITRREKE